MNGYTSFKEVAIWIQTKESAKVKIWYWPKTSPEHKKQTLPVITSKSKGFACTLLADQVEPGKQYEYEVEINDEKVELSSTCSFHTPSLWQWRKSPPQFSLLVGSCMYVNEEAFDRPGKPYGGDYEILSTMNEHHAELMLWLGDNTYFREVDWDSKTGIYHRHTHTRSLKALQPFLSTTHHYAIWDDHDYGPNDATGSFYHKQLTREAFVNFWPNPNYDVAEDGGITGQFQYNDLDFFLLDNRWNRTPKFDSSERKILGKVQLDWLKSALKTSQSAFKIIMVGGQFLNPNKVYENFANYEKERNELLHFIQQEQIKNVIFLTGDRHHSEINRLTLNNGTIVYDVTASPLTSKAHKKLNEENALRIPGSLIKKRNFAKLTVRGKRKQRSIDVQFFDKKNKLLYQHTIQQQ